MKTAIVVAVIAVVYIGLTVWSFIALHCAYAALKRDGRPMTLAEVLPPPLADADNAAPLYEKALHILQTERIGDQTLRDRLHADVKLLNSTNLAATSLANFRGAITTPAAVEAMGLIVQAGMRKGCRFSWIADETHFNLQTSSGLQYFSELSDLNRIVSWEARRLAVDGDAAAARQMAVAHLRLARARIGTPCLVGSLVDLAQQGRTLPAVQIVCSRQPPSAVEAAELRSELLRCDDPNSCATAMDGERLSFGQQLFAAHSAAQAANLLTPPGNAPTTPAILTYQPFAALHDLTGRLLGVAYFSKANPVLRLDHAAYLDLRRQQATQSLESPFSPAHVPVWCLVAKASTDAEESYHNMFRRHLALVRCTASGLALLVYKKEQGKWPESLAMCMERVPVDPFNGKPLQYHQTANGFVVSSVGTTRKHDKQIAWEYEPDNVR